MVFVPKGATTSELEEIPVRRPRISHGFRARTTTKESRSNAKSGIDQTAQAAFCFPSELAISGLSESTTSILSDIMVGVVGVGQLRNSLVSQRANATKEDVLSMEGSQAYPGFYNSAYNTSRSLSEEL
jgi:hypothetical protein